MYSHGFTLIELMILVIIIGIMASIAIPAYQVYTIRARVTDGLFLANTAQLAISEYVQDHDVLPTNPSQLAYTPSSDTDNVDTISIDNNAVITISYTLLAGGGTIEVAPNLQPGGVIEWSCTGGNLDYKYRPTRCQP